MTIDLSQAKPGDVFLTRDEREAKFVGYLPELGSLPCLLLVKGQNSVDTYAVNGSYSTCSSTGWDIIAKKPEKRVLDIFVNVYADGNSARVHKSKSDADRLADPNRFDGRYVLMFLNGTVLQDLSRKEAEFFVKSVSVQGVA